MAIWYTWKETVQLIFEIEGIPMMCLYLQVVAWKDVGPDTYGILCNISNKTSALYWI